MNPEDLTQTQRSRVRKLLQAVHTADAERRLLEDEIELIAQEREEARLSMYKRERDAKARGGDAAYAEVAAEAAAKVARLTERLEDYRVQVHTIEDRMGPMSTVLGRIFETLGRSSSTSYHERLAELR